MLFVCLFGFFVCLFVVCLLFVCLFVFVCFLCLVFVCLVFVWLFVWVFWFCLFLRETDRQRERETHREGERASKVAAFRAQSNAIFPHTQKEYRKNVHLFSKDSFVQAHPPTYPPTPSKPGESKETGAVHKNQEQEKRSFKKKKVLVVAGAVCCVATECYILTSSILHRRTEPSFLCLVHRAVSLFAISQEQQCLRKTTTTQMLYGLETLRSQRRVTLMQWVTDIRRRNFVSDLVHLHV